MKKSILIGTRLIDHIDYPKVPNICIFNNPNDTKETIFREGDILDANSIIQLCKDIKPSDVSNYVSHKELQVVIDNVNNISNITNTLSDSINDVKSDLDNINTQINTINIKIPDLYTRISEVADDTHDNAVGIRTLRTDVDAAANKANDVYDITQSNLQYMNQINSELNTAQDDITKLKTKDTEFDAKIISINNNVSTINNNITKLYIAVSAAQNDIKTIEETIIKVQSIVSSIQGDIGELQYTNEEFNQHFTYTINCDERAAVYVAASMCENAIEENKAQWKTLRHAYIKFNRSNGSVTGFGEYFGDKQESTKNSRSYVSAYVFDSAKGRERLDYLI